MPIVAHPERYQGLDREVNLPGEWRAAGAYLQVNSASLIGRYGPDAQRVAMQLLGRGWVDYLSSDYHARGKPRVASARRLLTELGGEEHVQLLTEINPGRVVQGAAPLPVPPFQPKRGFFKRLKSLFR